MKKKPFLIYKSSAGSGKTYTLAKNYIRLSLKSPYHFKKILAVTFTNKAAKEMKERILDMISDIINQKEKELILEYAKTFKTSSDQIVKRTKNLQKNLMHNYSYFSITTIDTFFYSIIQSFTRDLKFRGIFNIEIDQELVSNEVIESFLSGLKKNSDVSKWLIEFSREKLMSEKDFMIFQELKNMLKNLFNEEFKSLSESIENKNYNSEIKSLKSKIYLVKSEFENLVVSKAKEIYELILNNGYDVIDFSYKENGVAGFIKKTSNGTITYPGSRVFECFNNIEKWVSKDNKNKEKIISFIERDLMTNMKEFVSHFEKKFIKYNTALELKNYIYVFGILSELQKQVVNYRDENEVILISDLSELLYEIIKDDNIPFVFENVGNTYDNFLIDEFQDTSKYQWENFKAMIKESLSYGNENLVVGDIKQSIYRWRGSDSKIMDSTINSQIDESLIKIKNLNINWRSGQNIVEFNNNIFSNISSSIKDEKIKKHLNEIYNVDIKQQVSGEMKKRGYVEILFQEKKFFSKEDKYNNIKDFTVKSIQRIQDKGFDAGDIGIIVRDNNEAKIIAEILIKESKENNKYNFNHVSADALDIKSSPIVLFFISVFQYMNNYKDRLSLSEMVHFYYKYVLDSKDISHYSMSNDDKLNCLPTDFKDNIFEISRMPIYEMVESIIRIFKLNTLKDYVPYLQAFQDSVLEYKQYRNGDASSFIEWWDKKNNKKLNLTEQKDSINLITIHKSKGLEFNFVIMPFFNWKLDNESSGYKENIIWVDLKRFDEEFEFPYPIKYKSNHPRSLYSDYYEKERIKSYEDNINLMYVSFTRPKLGLFVNASIKGKEMKTVSDLLYSNLEKDIFSNKFKIGTFKSVKNNSKIKETYNLDKYPSFSWKERIRIRTNSEDKIDFDNISRGKKIHNILMYIKNINQIDKGINLCISKNIISKSEKNYFLDMIKEIIHNPKVKPFFDSNLESYNEIEIINKNGNISRLDRIVEMKDKSINIIDYKTGTEKDEDILQVENYKNTLKEIEDKNINAYLIYIDLNKIVKV